MLSIFIFSKSQKYINTLITSLSSIHEIKILGFSTNISSHSFDYCNYVQSDIIIADSDFKKYINDNIQYNYYFITISQINNLDIKKVYNIITKLILDYKIQYKLNLSNIKHSSLFKLLNSNFNNNLSGTEYLLDYMSYWYNIYHLKMQDETFYESIIHALSEKYNINSNSIIWNINSSVSNTSQNKLSKDFNMLEVI